MALWLFYCGFSFLIPNGPATEDAPEGKPTEAQLGNVATAIFLFMATYSPGEGPVPFTYSAEAFPLYIRDVGMSFATATCWGFNFILSLTWPALVEAFTPTGAFCWYAGWNLFGWVYCYFFLPETVSHLFPFCPQKFNALLTHIRRKTSPSKNSTRSSTSATALTRVTTRRNCPGISTSTSYVATSNRPSLCSAGETQRSR